MELYQFHLPSIFSHFIISLCYFIPSYDLTITVIRKIRHLEEKIGKNNFGNLIAVAMAVAGIYRFFLAGPPR